MKVRDWSTVIIVILAIIAVILGVLWNASRPLSALLLWLVIGAPRLVAMEEGYEDARLYCL